MSDIGGSNPEGTEVTAPQPESVPAVSQEGISRIQGTNVSAEVTDTAEAAPPPNNIPAQEEPPVTESPATDLSKKAVSAIQGEE